MLRRLRIPRWTFSAAMVTSLKDLRVCDSPDHRASSSPRRYKSQVCDIVGTQREQFYLQNQIETSKKPFHDLVFSNRSPLALVNDVLGSLQAGIPWNKERHNRF